MKIAIRSLVGPLLDLVFPPELYCICCHKATDSTRTYRLCNRCISEIKWIGDRSCIKCGKPLADANTTEVCFSCRENRHYFDRGYSCAEYGSNERAMIFSLKYGGHTDIAVTLGEIMYDRMTAEYDAEELSIRYDSVIPVPVSSARRAARGFNQAELLADEFARRAGIRLDSRSLIRVRDTHAMKTLGPEERRANISGAFRIREHRRAAISGMRILLIDDLYTTGATVDEISRELRSAGAERIDILTFAAGADVIKNS